MKIAVLGAGSMGQVAIRDLVESSLVTEILVGDQELERADKLKRELASSKITTCRVDVNDCSSCAPILAGWETVINCSPYYFNVSVMEACLEARCNYLDLGGLFHVTRKQLALHKQFEEKKLLAVLGMGAAPGLTNVMAAHAVSCLTLVHSIEIVAAAVDLVNHEHPFLPPYALDTILDEYFLEPVVFEDGKFIAKSPGSGEVVMDFPLPVGRATSFLTLHSEVATLPLTYASKGIKNVTYRLGLPQLFHERAKFLVELGFASNQLSTFGGLELSPRKILAGMIAQHPLPETEPNDCEVIRVDVKGQQEERETLIRMETIVFSDKRWQISSGALDTGVPPSIVAQMIGKKLICQHGVLAPEQCVPSQLFFEELAKRGISMRKIVDEAITVLAVPGSIR